MAMTDEELLLQMNILASKTDSTTNPNMVFKKSTILNKALDPTYFTGNDTKIVNAINLLAGKITDATNSVLDLNDKVNSILLDTGNSVNQQIWEELQALMGKPTIIEGLKNILEGGNQQRILGITAEDVGKILSVAQDEDGNVIVKAIELAAGGGSGEVPTANEIGYTNVDHPEITNVESALDYLFTNQGSSGGTIDSITWDKITNPPSIPNALELTDNSLVLKDEHGEMSSVPLMSNEDINTIVNSL